MRTVGLTLGLLLGFTAGSAALAQNASATPPAAIRTEPFPDVPQGHWAFDAVEQLRKQGILRGYPPATVPRPAPKRKPVSRKPRTA
jgi:hypothetical protein